MIFAGVIHRIQIGFDNVPALHGDTPVPYAIVTLHLRADAQAATLLRDMAGEQQVVHVTFEVVGATQRQHGGQAYGHPVA